MCTSAIVTTFLCSMGLVLAASGCRQATRSESASETVRAQPSASARSPSPMLVGAGNNFMLPTAAESAMTTIRHAIDVCAHNLANAETIGFRATRLEFVESPPTLTATDSGPLLIGSGLSVHRISINMQPGRLEYRGRRLDVAIVGTGFFRVQNESTGGVAYTRAGDLGINSAGELVLANDPSARLLPVVQIPADIRGDPVIQSNGEIFAMVGNSTSATKIGDMELTTFINAEGLRPIGKARFVESEASGPPITLVPGTDGVGTLDQGLCESSNVDADTEQLRLVRLQRLHAMWRQVAIDGPPVAARAAGQMSIVHVQGDAGGW